MSVNQHSSENQQQYHIADNEIDLRELFKAVWQGKWIIIATTFVFAVAAIIYALSLPNIYKSEALLAPASEQKAGISGQLGGLAALAGVNLGSGAGVDKTALAMEIIKSREFISRFIDKYDILVPLMAAEKWHLESNTLSYDDEVYNINSGEWLREAKPPRLAQPSLQEAYKVFTEILTVSQDKATGMVKISIEHLSPYVAQQWTTMLVYELNQDMKQRDIAEAERAIIYLQKQIAETNVTDIRSALFSLIEDQTKTLMLANARDEYIFKTVDSAIVSEEKAKPARAVICILSVMMGSILSILIVFVRYFYSK